MEMDVHSNLFFAIRLHFTIEWNTYTFTYKLGIQQSMKVYVPLFLSPKGLV